MSGDSSGFSQPQYHDGTPRASDAAQTALCSGANFSLYVLRELIGAGNTASVYRAHDPRLRREVAVKILNTGALAGENGLARFLHEARMAAAVRHPNVVSIFDVGVHDATPYIVMELLEGQNLDVRLSAARVLREPVLIDIALQLVSGLAAVHDAGVVHRDLRPSNVFLARTPSGVAQPKLLDFGVSKQMHDNLRLTTNGRRRWAAMPLYTAPEVLLDGDATFHSDQYSLGVVLYECVTGVNPFRADTTLESIELITTGQARRITEQPIRPSRRLAAIIEKAMHVYPDRRFADLREIGEALASLSERRGRWTWLERGARPVRSPAPRASDRPAPSSAAPFDSAPTSKDRRELSWALGATVVACSIGAPVWAWWSVHRQRTPAPISAAAPWVATDSAPVAAAPPAPVAAPQPSLAQPTASQPSASLLPPLQLPPTQPPLTQPASAPVDAHAELSAPAPTAPLPAAAEAAAPAPALASTAEPVASTAPAAPVSDAELASSAGEAAPPHAEGPELAPPATGTSDGTAPAEGVAPASDGGPTAPHDTDDLPSPSLVAAPAKGPERGTNGALIFD
ncbi:MAG TPA: protein kinase [Polyangiaceae bacterium]|nr:protein kinase [Polyangiaceae bacterium]